MEDNKEQTAESSTPTNKDTSSSSSATTVAAAAVTDLKPENDSNVNMSVASPAGEINQETTDNQSKMNVDSSSTAGAEASSDTKTNLIHLTVKTPKEKESVTIHADANVKEVS